MSGEKEKKDKFENLPPIPRKLIKPTGDGTNLTYNLTRRLGCGGFAVVYEAEEEETGRNVALKCISKIRFNDDSKFKRKIMSEIEIHRNLNNENIIDFLGVFQDDDYIYITLELCTKGNLLEYLRKDPPFSEKKTSQIVKLMLNALIYLHSNGIIHHDVKLQNFLINEMAQLKLCDFGLSLNMNRKRKHHHSSICGTPGYISPEIVQREKIITAAVDIWALGVCTFLMLTAKQPFHHGDRQETYQNIKDINYKWPKTPLVSDVAKSFIEAIFQKDPSKRPTASELLNHPFITNNEGDNEDENLNAKRYNGWYEESSIPASSSSIPEDEPDTNINVNNTAPIVRLPQNAVKMWCDYTSKYGLAYILYNGQYGAVFNDNTQLAMDSQTRYVQYYSGPNVKTHQTYYYRDIDFSPVKKKMIIIQRLAQELKKCSQLPDVNQSDDSTDSTENVYQIELPRVKSWHKSQEGILFRFNNKDIQANFKDKTKIFLQSNTKTLFYVSGDSTVQLPITDLTDHTKYHEIRTHFYYVKKMVKEMNV
ncbi:CAMK family protein kinase [Tritrichomonas foetus]|uniref:Serine/threonine-protein kinase PLK n=1 Tax=Tritrichomonas foetus TaxID=1144522 RepID=A0A1J4L4Z6_9EUKA|nr:CAMK family protein kinase [Tritrichomonas foetus]|eukprot:OHT17005.1 CAMK family protein kinase [Tritrichomonas foetus]